MPINADSGVSACETAEKKGPGLDPESSGEMEWRVPLWLFSVTLFFVSEW